MKGRNRFNLAYARGEDITCAGYLYFWASCPSMKQQAADFGAFIRACDLRWSRPFAIEAPGRS